MGGICEQNPDNFEASQSFYVHVLYYANPKCIERDSEEINTLQKLF